MAPLTPPLSHAVRRRSLSNFTEMEVLNGDNQYFCETCGKKCDAHKGIKFKELPPVLTLSLNRFRSAPARPAGPTRAAHVEIVPAAPSQPLSPTSLALRSPLPVFQL